MLWHIGNTTVRTPYRLRDALSVLRDSPLNGNLSGRRQENEFAKLLHDRGILESPRVAENEDASDLGRKWRAALSQLGFITPRLTRNTKSGSVDPALSPIVANIDGLSGYPYEITPSGHKLIEAEIITAQQECFLRSIASYRVPSLLEPGESGHVPPFLPLRFVLTVIDGLGSRGHDERLSFQEFALFVQTSSPHVGEEAIIGKIISYRQGSKAGQYGTRTIDAELYERTAAEQDRKPSTLDDYTDLSFRYLKATGIFRAAKRGIALSPSRVRLAKLLQAGEIEEVSDHEYLQSIWLGAGLPTDSAAASYAVVQHLMQKFKERGERVSPIPTGASMLDIETRRHELEARLLQLEEEDYADQQAEKVDEIAAWMEALSSRGRAQLPETGVVSIPRGEAPAYLEWIVWRSFLAIDSLCNKPRESRNFQVDQDFLPVSCAPGGGPDMVFEFQNATIVVEVTLTSSSRQEAAEGEPVRRHVAQYAQNATKPVYGLFIAISIDSNTAHTFRSGDWYLAGDDKLTLDIVPLTLRDFGKLLVAGKECLAHMPELLKSLIIECRAKANQDAPLWKRSISEILASASERLEQRAARTDGGV